MAVLETAPRQSENGVAEMEYRVRVPDERTIACLGLGSVTGPPVLYFHGYPGSRFEARVAAAAACRLGLRLLAIDRPGFGESTFQCGRRIGDWPADVAALADAFGLKRFSIVGVSGGAPYALACAASLANRLHRVALLCPLSPLNDAGDTAGMIMHDRLMLALAFHAPPLARAAVHLIAHWMRRYPDRCLKFMMTGLLAPDRDLFADPGYRSLMANSTMQAVRQGGRGAAWELTLITRPWGFRLEDVRMRVTVWQGLADQILPAHMARRLVAALPACDSRYIAGEGHLSLVARRIGELLTELYPAGVPSTAKE